MTIASRNRFIRIATVLSFLLFIASAISIFLIIFQKKIPSTPVGLRMAVFPNIAFLTPYSPLADLLAAGLFPLFSLVSLLYILFAFEKTQTVEMTFFSAFAFVAGLEATRLVIPLYGLWNYSSFFSMTITRIVIFSRIFILLALLASAISSTAKTIQQLGPTLFLLAFFSVTLANAIPLNTGTSSSTFILVSGFRETVKNFWYLLGLLSILSYLILGKTRNVPEYRRAAGGIVLLLAGYALLANCDSWFFLIPGTALFFGGAVLYLKPMHQYYLWQ
jgi:hypothetical protein